MGASAGGITALKELFRNATKNERMAFIILMHMARDKPTIINEIIQASTKLSVKMAEESEKIKRGTVYFPPPGRYVRITDGRISLALIPEHQKFPIDHLFSHLASEFGKKAIGIILSGNGSDGTMGIRKIKENGGLVIVQDPESAEFNGMPLSVIHSGLEDRIMRPGEIIPSIRNLVEHPYFQKDHLKIDEDVIRGILKVVHEKGGQDFSDYKNTTIERRIKRRMVVNQFSHASDYLSHINNHPKEAKDLMKELLIGVTSFFRDKEPFMKLEELVIPVLLKRSNGDSQIRIWVPGCSTGEEAYTIGILFKEKMKEMDIHPQVRVFATDIDRESLAVARTGRFDESSLRDMSDKRRKMYFKKSNDGYRIEESIRDMIIFSVQDVINDPPFSRLDMISCRNLFIYLNSDLQNRVLSIFNYALEEGGYLFLGTSETVGKQSAKFSPVDLRNKIYSKKGSERSFHGFMKKKDGSMEFKSIENDVNNKKEKQDKIDYGALLEKTLLRNLSPPSIIVNKDHEIFYFYGDTRRFLNPPQGHATLNLLSMTDKKLAPIIQKTLKDASVQNRPVTSRGILMEDEGSNIPVNITVYPVASPARDPLFVVGFFEVSHVDDTEENEEGTVDSKVMNLKDELRRTKEHLSATVEQLEAANEELKATNEELESSNEELQSTNEELETSREELQSLNEELMTMNTEHQQKIESLEQSNSDLNRLISGTGIATIYLDQNMRVKKFTESLYDLIKVRSIDEGRPISELSNVFPDMELTREIEKLREGDNLINIDVRSFNGHWFNLKIMRQESEEGTSDEGFILTFFDITRFRKDQD